MSLRKWATILKSVDKTDFDQFKLYSVTEQPISIEIIFSRILSVPKRRTPKQIRDWSIRYENSFQNQSRICLGVLRLGTLRIREKIISIEMGCSVTLYITVKIFSSFFQNRNQNRVVKKFSTSTLVSLVYTSKSIWYN